MAEESKVTFPKLMCRARDHESPSGVGICLCLIANSSHIDRYQAKQARHLRDLSYSKCMKQNEEGGYPEYTPLLCAIREFFSRFLKGHLGGNLRRYVLESVEAAKLFLDLCYERQREKDGFVASDEEDVVWECTDIA